MRFIAVTSLLAAFLAHSAAGKSLLDDTVANVVALPDSSLLEDSDIVKTADVSGKAKTVSDLSILNDSDLDSDAVANAATDARANAESVAQLVDDSGSVVDADVRAKADVDRLLKIVARLLKGTRGKLVDLTDSGLDKVRDLVEGLVGDVKKIKEANGKTLDIVGGKVWPALLEDDVLVYSVVRLLSEALQKCAEREVPAVVPVAPVAPVVPVVPVVPVEPVEPVQPATKVVEKTTKTESIVPLGSRR